MPAGQFCAIEPTSRNAPGASPSGFDPLELVGLHELMALTSGAPSVTVGIIDGPVGPHRDLAPNAIRVAGRAAADDQRLSVGHGTFVVGVLGARRGSVAPAICPDCSMMSVQVLPDGTGNHSLPDVSIGELADAIINCVNAGCDVINVSLALASGMAKSKALDDALSWAASRGALVVVAAGNQGTMASNSLLRHPWTIPVAASDNYGRPAGGSNFGNSIGTKGVLAPGLDIVSLGIDGTYARGNGTSFAAPFVTGTIALLRSSFPSARSELILSVIRGHIASHGRSVIPPLLNARQCYAEISNSA